MKIVRTIALATLAALWVMPVSAQSADDVLEKYYAAIGGVDAWQSLSSVVATGTLDVMGMAQGPFVMTQQRPTRFRADISIQGMDIIQAYDGETAWQVMPMMGITSPTAADAGTAQGLMEQADLDGPLIGWKEDGYSIEVMGMEMVGDAETTKLKVTAENVLVTYFFLGEDYLPVQYVAERDVQGTMTEMTTKVSDYQDVDGLMFPFLIEIDTPMGMQSLIFDSVEVNVPVDESKFGMPSGQ